MVTITQRPIRTKGGITSRWSAAHNPFVYKFTRRDREISAVNLIGSNLRLTVDDTTGLVTGQQVYVSTTKYKGIGTVLIVVDGTTVTVSGFTPNGFDGSGYLNDVKRNYRININIYESGNDRFLGSTSCVPFTNGMGSKDLGVYVAAYLKLINTFTYDAVNKRDVNGSIKVYITYQEVFTGGSSSVISDSAQPVYAVNAAKQIGDVNGQNMLEFLPSYTPPQQGKFLTKFKRPVYFQGMPFSVSFIYPETMLVTLTKKETRLNVNKAVQSTNSVALDSQQRESVNRLMITGNYADNVKFVLLDIETGTLTTSDYVYPGYVDDGYVAQL